MAHLLTREADQRAPTMRSQMVALSTAITEEVAFFWVGRRVLEIGRGGKERFLIFKRYVCARTYLNYLYFVFYTCAYTNTYKDNFGT